MKPVARVLSCAIWCVLLAVPATAGVLGETGVPAASAIGGGGYSPRVPVSGLAPSMQWFDPGRLHLSTSFSIGTGFGGRAEGLQVTRLSYQFGAPVSLGVSLGNALGSTRSRDGNSFFLEGLDFAYQPSQRMLFQIHYQDLRSPLQYRPGFGGFDPGYWAR